MTGPFEKDARERFYSRLKVEGECIVWAGHLNKNGYGVFNNGDRKFYAHRVACSIKLGRAIDQDEVVMHACDNRACCNPAHLAVGTIRENNEDRARKGRSAKSGKFSAKLSPGAVLEIRVLLKMGQGVCRIAARYGCGEKAIRDIRDNVTYRRVQAAPTLFQQVSA